MYIYYDVRGNKNKTINLTKIYKSSQIQFKEVYGGI